MKFKLVVSSVLLAALGCSSAESGPNGAQAGSAAGHGGVTAVNAAGAANGGNAGSNATRAGAAGLDLGGSGASGSEHSGGASTAGGGAANVAGSANPGAGNGGASGSAGNGGGSGTAGASGSAGSGGGPAETVNATAMVKDMGFGTNIGNTLENTLTWETGWGQPLITQAYINGMASHGIKTVRVPVAWDTYATNGVIDPAKMTRVKQVVSWLEAAGIYSIVNIHWDGGWVNNSNEGNPNKYKLTDDLKAKFASYWKQIGAAFSGVGHKLILEGLNEDGTFYVNGDTNQPDYTALLALNQLFVTTVRAQGGYNVTRALLIAGFSTDVDHTCVDAFGIPTDPAGEGKLFLSIHYYTPFTFAQLDKVETWGTPKTTWGTSAEKAELEGLFDKMGSFITKRKIPVILGEFGVTRGQNYIREKASRTLWMESVTKASIARGIVPVLWDTGDDISRADGSLSSELQTVMTDTKP
jgi:endoglucanase